MHGERLPAFAVPSLESFLVDVRFEIEEFIPRLSLVMARSLDGSEFEVGEAALLNGCRVSSWDIPRAADDDGCQRLDLFGFIVEVDDPAKFAPGRLALLQKNPTADQTG